MTFNVDVQHILLIRIIWFMSSFLITSIVRHPQSRESQAEYFNLRQDYDNFTPPLGLQYGSKQAESQHSV